MVLGTEIQQPAHHARPLPQERPAHFAQQQRIRRSDPVKGLKLRSQFTYYSYQRHGRYYEPGYLPAKKENEGGYASRDEYDDTSFSSENTVYYELRPKSGHNFDVLGGYTAQIKYDNNLSITGRGYTLDELTWNNMAAVPDKQNTSISTNHTDWTKMSVFGRLNYNYKERYYVTFTARYDGASNFAANKKWGFFPSAALRWNIANEKFLQKPSGSTNWPCAPASDAPVTTPSRPTVRWQPSATRRAAT